MLFVHFGVTQQLPQAWVATKIRGAASRPSGGVHKEDNP